MNKYPFRVTLLLLLVLSFTAWNLLRVWTALAWRDTLVEATSTRIFAIIAISGAVWSLVGVFTAWLIMYKKTWARKVLVVVAVAYSLWDWAARLLWENPRPNWIFTVIVNLGLFVFILFAQKSLSREAYERENQKPAIE